MNFQHDIRLATASDYDQLCELFEELDTWHRQARPDLFRKPDGPPRERAFVTSLIDGPESAILVAHSRLSNRLLGFATLVTRHIPEHPVRPKRRICEIDNFGVRASVRRRGIGRALIVRSVDWAAEHGFPAVELAVHEFNANALRFYQAIGFSTTLRRMARTC